MSFLLFVSFANRFFFAFLAFSPSFRSSACFVRSGTNSNSYLDLDFFEASQLTSSAGQARVKSGLFFVSFYGSWWRSVGLLLFIYSASSKFSFLISRFVCVCRPWDMVTGFFMFFNIILVFSCLCFYKRKLVVFFTLKAGEEAVMKEMH